MPRVLRQISILQVNVGRSWAAHETALQLAYEQHFHAILIQEPWVLPDRSRRLSKKHPAFSQFSPVEDWTDRPRALTYIQRSPYLSAHQVPLGPPCQDLLAVQLSTPKQALLLVNLYNAPTGSIREHQGLGALLSTSLPTSPCLLAGDFNLRHPLWQATTSPSTRAEPFLIWAESHLLSMTLPPNTPTHNQNMIDLSWANPALYRMGVTSGVPDDLPSLADHNPVATTINWGLFKTPQAQPPLRRSTLDEDIFQQTLQQSSQATYQLASSLYESLPPTEGQLDDLASNIISTIILAAEAATRRAYPQPSGHKWWSLECSEAVHSLHQATRNPETSEEEKGLAKRAFRRNIRQAKRQYWRGAMEDMTEPQDAFKAAKWSRSEGCFPIAPLQEGHITHTAPEEKADFLVRTLLQKAAGAEDIEPEVPEAQASTLPFPAIQEHEVKTAIFSPKNSTPGQDGIPTNILKKAWTCLSGPITALFQQCLEKGWHPLPFRQATLVALPKPGKRDRSSPRSYRLIALLSVLGKGLERLMAKRMAWLAITHKILHPQQFGALPCRSATDLATCLIHDVEDAWARGYRASMLSLDIKGAFDAVLPGRLIKRLCNQGWPPKVVHWVASFMANRSACLRLGDFTSQDFGVASGLPQGSPISPIPFMLFIEPLFKCGPLAAKRGRFGYADDIGQLVASPSLAENINILNSWLADLQQWTEQEGLAFDFSKSEIQHFSRGKQGDPPLLIPSPGGPYTISPPGKGAATRWLGIWFDRRLTFHPHCKIMAARAKQTVTGILSLANTARGVRASLLRKVTTACVLSVLAYGAEAWWPGFFWQKKEQPVSTRVGAAFSHLERVFRQALRGSLPVYRTTPTPVLYRESAHPPLEFFFNHRRALAHLRIACLDGRHPVRRRALRTRPTNPCLRFHFLRPECLGVMEHVSPIHFPPWQAPTRRDRAAICPDREKAPQDFYKWTSSLPPLSMLIFTDGSLQQTGAAGAGWAGLWGTASLEATRGYRNLAKHEVFDAEATAALAGLKAAFSCPQTHLSSNLYITG